MKKEKQDEKIDDKIYIDRYDVYANKTNEK